MEAERGELGYLTWLELVGNINSVNKESKKMREDSYRLVVGLPLKIEGAEADERIVKRKYYSD